jgi:hypothetical protein
MVARSGIRRTTWSAMARSIRPAGRVGSSIGGAAAGTSTSIAVGSIAASPWAPRQFGVDLRDYQPRPADRRVQMLDAEPGIVTPRFVRAADLQQHDVDRQAATRYQAANIGNIGRHDVVGAGGEKPPPGAGAAQCGDGDVGVVGAEAVAEGQREKHTEWRAALRLRIKQAGEEHRFRRRLSPPDCLAGTDQLRKIERFGRYGDRGFHAPLMAAISPAQSTDVLGPPGRVARPRIPVARRSPAEES